MLEFEVIDNLTGNAPDCEKIALTEEWAKHLIYCDIDCFAITEDGDLILIDDCNNIAYPPSDRFTVKFDPESLRTKGRWIHYKHFPSQCSECGEVSPGDCELSEFYDSNYCPNCGAKMEE